MTRRFLPLILLALAAVPPRAALAARAARPTPAPTPAALTAPRWDVSLAAAEDAALRTSPTLAAAKADRLSSEKNADAQGTLLLPQLSLSASATYLDKLPEMSVLPGRPPVVLGDHNNWMVGASASWTVWDWGALRNAWKSASAAANRSGESERLTRRQTLLAVRSSYLQVRLASEQCRLLSDSLSLAESQLRDVQARVAAGTAGALDLSSAKQEALSRRRGLREARASLAGALRDLSDLTGIPSPADPSLPLDGTTAAQPPPGIEAPTLLLTLEDEAPLRDHLAPPSADPAGADQPQVRQWEAAAESSRRQAASAKAGLLPKIQVSGLADYQYPYQSELKTIQQNAVMATATMPLFDWGREWKQSASARAAAEAAEARRAQALADWERDVKKARDQYAALLAESDLDRQSAAEADAFARLVGDSYRAGRSTYLEVESADLKALESQVTFARTKIQVWLQAAVLRSLTLDEAKE